MSSGAASSSRLGAIFNQVGHARASPRGDCVQPLRAILHALSHRDVLPAAADGHREGGRRLPHHARAHQPIAPPCTPPTTTAAFTPPTTHRHIHSTVSAVLQLHAQATRRAQSVRGEGGSPGLGLRPHPACLASTPTFTSPSHFHSRFHTRFQPRRHTSIHTFRTRTPPRRTSSRARPLASRGRTSKRPMPTETRGSRAHLPPSEGKGAARVNADEIVLWIWNPPCTYTWTYT